MSTFYSVGDRVRVSTGLGDHLAGGQTGTIIQVSDWEESFPYRVDLDDDLGNFYYGAHELERVVDDVPAEIPAASVRVVSLYEIDVDGENVLTLDSDQAYALFRALSEEF